MKKFCFLAFICSLVLLCICLPVNFAYVSFAQEEEEVYLILDEDYVYINSSYDVQLGDMFISEDNVLYEIYEVNEEALVAYARPQEKVKMPKVEENPEKITNISAYEKRIGMYHTHNDESYVIGDGYDSVYGEGGIMDIGDAFARELKKFNIIVYKDDSLHLPHDSKAYVRSKSTAQSLLKKAPLDAIFDVHRDGVSRKQFLGQINGKEGSKIRIVIGKSNSNYQKNLEIAKEIKAYADVKYPGLIKDIYIGSGNYNQNLSKNALLFEMGTYLIEKDYVMSSLPYLADTIDKVMYTTAVESPNEDESFAETIIEGENTTTKEETKIEEPSKSIKWIFIAIFVAVILGGGGLLVVKNINLLKKGKNK